MTAPCLLALLASLAGAPKIVAVIPFEQRGTADPMLRDVLEESLRTEAIRRLGDDTVVLTGENTLRVLADNGIDPGRVCAESCALEAGREAKARVVFGGTVLSVGGELVVFVRAYDTGSGGTLASVSLAGESGRALRLALEARSGELFEPIRRFLSDDAPPAGRRVTFRSAVPDLPWSLHADGEELCRLPCTRKVGESERLNLLSPQAVRLELPPFDHFAPRVPLLVLAHPEARPVAATIALVVGGAVLGGVVGAGVSDPGFFGLGTLLGGLSGMLVGTALGAIPAVIVHAAAREPARLEVLPQPAPADSAN